MAESFMQVPVSLIEDVKALIEKHQPEAWELDAYEHSTDGVGCSHCAELDSNGSLAQDFPCEPRRDLESILALLSQPTPTAEPAQAWRDRQGDVWTEGDDGLMHTPDTAPFSRGHVEKKWGPLVPVAAPPSIADMVPGGRFCNNSAGHSTHLWHPAPFDSTFGDVHYTCPGRIDPSTIRDVTPPAAP